MIKDYAMLAPMSFFRFAARQPGILAFGVLLTLFSSFGQTFLISIFVPRMIDDLGLTTGAFGVLYSVATVVSATCLPFFGRMLDRFSVRRYTIAVSVALMLACWLVSLATHAATLFVGIVGLRLAGQGLMGLTASTTMARCFPFDKGKALSISAVGYPLGEGFLPMVTVFLIALYGWRTSWQILGAVIALLLIPMVFSLVRNIPKPEPVMNDGNIVRITSAVVLRDKRFFMLLPGLLIMPFVLTGLFLYQLPLADFKGWKVEVIAMGFIGFASARFVSSLLIGPLIDRLGSIRLIPFTLIPMAGGLMALWWVSETWGALAFLVLVGLGQGPAGSIATAVWADLYGLDSLGSIKSLVAMLGVYSTALSPILMGFMLDSAIGFEYMIPGFLGMTILAFGLSWFTSKKLLRELQMGSPASPA
jgi:MFS family permease